MKTQTDYDIYRDNLTFVSKDSVSTIEYLQMSNKAGLTMDKTHIDKLFFIASKGVKSKKIVWDLVKKNKVTVLRAHGKPNEYQKILESVKKECSNQ